MLINEINIIRTGLENDSPIINSGRSVLLEHEYPILYIGQNAYDSWVLGSFLEEDEDDLTILYYISFVLKKHDYLAFLSKRISYRDIFEMYTTAYVLKCDLATLNPLEVYLVDARQIEHEYWPHEQSFYPSDRVAPVSSSTERVSTSLVYSIKLRGGLADAHLARLNDSIVVQQAMVGLLGESIHNLPNLAVSADILQSVPTQGSFKFNFEVDITLDDTKAGDLFFNKESFGVYQNELIEYAIKYLPTEVNTVFYGENLPTHFVTLFEKTKALYTSLGKSVGDEDLIYALKECVHGAAESIVNASKAIGSAYESIEFLALPVGEDNESMGIVTTDSRTALASAVEFIDRLAVEPDDSETDAEPQAYKIRIYNLNTESRKGSGFIILEDGTVFKPKITISGNGPLEETKYTQSIHLKNIIDVIGIGTRKKGRLTKLLIEG